MRIILIPLFLTLTGCAQKVWYNPEKSTQQFYADNANCTAMSQGVSSNQIQPSYGYNSAFGSGFVQGFNTTNAIMAANTKNQIYSDCMMGNGWTLVDKKRVNSPASEYQDNHASEINYTSEPNNKKGDEKETLAKAFNSVPELSSWQESYPQKFETAIIMDDILRDNPFWEYSPLSERFHTAKLMTDAIYGDAAKFKEMCLMDNALKGTKIKYKYILASIRSFHDDVLGKYNQMCLDGHDSGESKKVYEQIHAEAKLISQELKNKLH
ncbi:hypothetical protein J9T75_002923 [Salmonella enterica]|nr:hypothetical protein [Salmonella enterica]